MARWRWWPQQTHYHNPEGSKTNLLSIPPPQTRTTITHRFSHWTIWKIWKLESCSSSSSIAYEKIGYQQNIVVFLTFCNLSKMALTLLDSQFIGSSCSPLCRSWIESTYIPLWKLVLIQIYNQSTDTDASCRFNYTNINILVAKTTHLFISAVLHKNERLCNLIVTFIRIFL